MLKNNLKAKNLELVGLKVQQQEELNKLSKQWVWRSLASLCLFIQMLLFSVHTRQRWVWSDQCWDVLPFVCWHPLWWFRSYLKSIGATETGKAWQGAAVKMSFSDSFHHGGLLLMNGISVTSTIQHWYCGNRLESAKTLFQVFCVNQCSFGGKKSLRDLKTCKCLALSKYLVTGLHLHI